MANTLRRQLAPLAVLAVVVAAVVGVAGLRARADGGRRAELLLVRLDGLTQEQYAQLGRAVADGGADRALLDEGRASRAAFDSTLGALAASGATDAPELAGLDANIASFRRSSDAAL